MLAEIFLTFLRLGCTSFGGPVAHLGYFERELVARRSWCSSARFAELVALAQALPGPTSSQVGVALGMVRGGALGGLAAWLGFTLPSAAIMLALVLWQPHGVWARVGGWVSHGLELAASAVVAQAVLTMRRQLAPDWPRISLAAASAVIVLLAVPFWGSAFALLLGATVGLLVLRGKVSHGSTSEASPLPQALSVWAAVAFAALFLVPVVSHSRPAQVFAAFYRSGALVFGGGHVVLPLMQQTVVSAGLVPERTFLAGYGAAQMLPGPLFSVAAFLGASVTGAAHPFAMGLLALAAIFLPGMLLLCAVLPVLTAFRGDRKAAAALAGVNASVVGVLAAALIRPLGTTAIVRPIDAAIALSGFAMLAWPRLPAWVVVPAVVAASFVASLL